TSSLYPDRGLRVSGPMCSHAYDTPPGAGSPMMGGNRPVRQGSPAMQEARRPLLGAGMTRQLKGQRMSEQRDLEGLSALVTGATSGIGKAAVEQLARHGAEVIVHGRDAARGQAVVDVIMAEGGKARFVAADLTDPAALDDLAQQAAGVDVLVNNAGYAWFGPTPELDPATFALLFAANV